MEKMFKCPNCGEKIPFEMKQILAHTQRDIIDSIKHDHPDWAENDGTCKKCLEYYKKKREKGR